MATALAPSPYEQPAVPDVYRCICQVAKALSRDGISKGSRNQQQGYSFRGIDDIYNALSAQLAVADLCILPRMVSRTQEERTTAKGGVLFYVTVQAEFDFVSAKDGSHHTVTMFGEAMDTADKATNKAMSAAYKYACLQVFCIPTEGMANDADATTHEPAPKQTPAQKKVLESKLAAIRQPQPVAAIAEQIPEPENEDRDYTYEPIEDQAPAEEPASELEQELHDSIVAVEVAKLQAGTKRRTPDKFSMLKAFGELKARYKAIDYLKTYYAFLGLYGVQHANEFEDTEEGRAQARCCFKEMSIDVANREVKAR